VACLAATVLASGCFHTSQFLDAQLVPVSELQSTHSGDVVVPGTEVVTVDSTLDGAMLAIQTTLRAQCRATTFETWQNYEKRLVSLPAVHWLVLGTGLAAAAGGGVTLGIGSNYASAPSTTAVLDPGVEETRDTGAMMMTIGGALVGTGVVMLVSELVDAVLLEDSRRATDQVVKPVQGEARPCAEGPAKGHRIDIETPPSGAQLSRRVTVVTDDFGRATVDLRTPEFNEFAYGDPFAIMTCEHCAGWNLTLMPAGVAEVAIYRRDLDMLRRWMGLHGASESSDIVARVQEATERRQVVDLGDAVTFDLGSSRLRNAAGPHLDQTAAFLLKRRNIQLRIEGHTDTSGTEAKNRNLSKERAEAVKKYLVRRGVPSDRLITIGMAASRPAKSNKTEGGRRANRRYHFQLLED
jgi:outer membrane protein OmpA-like peptidoglycan-associated protein